MEKYHKQDAAPIEKENERDKNYDATNPQIDSERTRNNYCFTPYFGKTYTEFINDRIKELGLSPRKDAVVMNSFVLDSDKQFFDGLSKVENCPTKKYHQVFKYAVGGFFKKGNVDILKNADDLYNLDNALHKRKMIQGYGAFRKLVPKIKYISKNSIKTDNEKE